MFFSQQFVCFLLISCIQYTYVIAKCVLKFSKLSIESGQKLVRQIIVKSGQKLLHALYQNAGSAGKGHNM